jgi:hypothetical protein
MTEPTLDVTDVPFRILFAGLGRVVLLTEDDALLAMLSAALDAYRTSPVATPVGLIAYLTIRETPPQEENTP